MSRAIAAHAAAAFAMLLLASACREPPPAPPPSSPLVGTRWTAREVATAPTIEFAANRAGGTTGCNRWFAQAEGAHPELRFSAISATRRICGDAAMQSEQAFIAALEATRSVRPTDATLVLIGEDGTELMTLERRN